MQTAFIVLIITIIASRFVLIDAVKKLSDEDKLKLMSGKLLNQAQLRSVIVLAIAGIFYFAITSYPDYAVYLLAIFIVFIVAERIYACVTAKKKIQALGLPPFYLHKFTLASIISNAGLLLFFMLLLKDLF